MIDGFDRPLPAFLASVTTPEEAGQALAGGADIVDCKDPSQGALGALGLSVIRTIVDDIGGRLPVSATIGDLPADPGLMVKAAMSVAATGADIVKVGFFGDADPRAAILALGAASLGRTRLVAVLMADRAPDFAVVASLAHAGFLGVMLDTADKSSGALPEVLERRRLADFLSLARKHTLSAGLAGALRHKHIPDIVALQPDVIGFRGALCDSGRTSPLNVTHVRAVRAAIDVAIQSEFHSSAKRSAAKRSVA